MKACVSSKKRSPFEPIIGGWKLKIGFIVDEFRDMGDQLLE